MRRSYKLLLGVLSGVTAACGASGGSSGTGAGGGSGGSTTVTGAGGANTTSGAGGATTTSTSSSTTTDTGATTGAGGATTGVGGGGGAGGSVPACPQGTIQCDGNTKKVCDGNGGFSEVTDCGQQVCVDGLGCLVCKPGTGSCNGDVGTSCKADGSGYVTETCDALQGTSCNAQTGTCDGACSLQALGKSYIGCDYYPTVTSNAVSSTFDFAVAVSNTTATDATVTITKAGAVVKTVTVAANSVQVVTLPWVSQLKGPDANIFGQPSPMAGSVRVDGGAYRLRSTQPVTVYQFNPLQYQKQQTYSYSNDASLLLPVNVWTGNYDVVARHHWAAANTSGFYAITASQDGTNVTVTAPPGAPSTLVKAGVNGIATSGSGTVTMNAGDVVEIVTAAPKQNQDNDVTGTVIAADKPVQVIGGHQCINVPDAVGYCDHLEDALFPYETVSSSYIVTAPLIPPVNNPTTKVEMVRILATKANTTLTYDPPQAGAPTTIAQAGQFIEIANTKADFAITASDPVMVMQYMEGQDAGGNTGDPAMAIAIGKEQYRKSYLFHAPTNYEASFVNVVCPAGTNASIDGAAIASFAPIGNTGFGVARQSVSNAGNGNHTLTADKPCGLSVYGYGQYTSYWYPGGSDLQQLHM